MIKRLIYIAVVLFAIVLSIDITSRIYNKRLTKSKLAIRTATIRNDSLVELNRGLYTKLVADTLSKKELQAEVETLKLKLKAPRLVIKKVLEFEDVETNIEGTITKDSILKTEDYYPNKDNIFITYKSTLDLSNLKGEGSFKIEPIALSLGIGQNKDGTYRVTTKLPEFITLSSLEVKSLPLTPTKKDNFGWILGGGLGHNFNKGNNYYVVSAGMRVHKTYLEVDISTEATIEGKIKFEF